MGCASRTSRTGHHRRKIHGIWSASRSGFWPDRWRQTVPDTINQHSRVFATLTAACRRSPVFSAAARGAGVQNGGDHTKSPKRSPPVHQVVHVLVVVCSGHANSVGPRGPGQLDRQRFTPAGVRRPRWGWRDVGPVSCLRVEHDQGPYAGRQLGQASGLTAMTPPRSRVSYVCCPGRGRRASRAISRAKGPDTCPGSRTIWSRPSSVWPVNSFRKRSAF
jgi:hypothetical protein